MCGAGVAIGKDPGFLDAHGETLNGCYVWVEKEKDMLKGKYCAQLVGAGTVGLTTVAKSSLAQPCTNRPFKCVEKDCHTYVWTYSIKNHYKDFHADIPVPSEVFEQRAKRAHESACVNQWKKE
jgi:hypothetical protein